MLLGSNQTLPVPRKFRLEQFYRPRLLPQERALQARVGRGGSLTVCLLLSSQAWEVPGWGPPAICGAQALALEERRC